MTEVAIGGRTYRIRAERRGTEWTAHAERTDDGDRHGVEYTAPSEAEATQHVVAWLEWQHEHAIALEALQQAERAYHRTIAGSAFASPLEGPTAIELQKESLEEVERARDRLDEVRARRPE